MAQSSSLDSLQDPGFSSRWQQCHYDAKHDRRRMGTKISRRPNCKSENSTHGNHGPVQLIQDIYIYICIYIILFAHVTILLIVGRNLHSGVLSGHINDAVKYVWLTQKGTMQCLKVMGKKGAAVAGSCTWHALKWRGRSGRPFAGPSSRRRRARGGCMAARSSASLHDPLMFLSKEGWKCWTADDASAARGTPALDSEIVWCWSDRYFNDISNTVGKPSHIYPKLQVLLTIFHTA